MRAVFACIAFFLSAMCYGFIAIVFLHPLYVFGLGEGWRWVLMERDWLEITIIAAVLLFGTVMLTLGASLSHRRQPPA